MNKYFCDRCGIEIKKGYVSKICLDTELVNEILMLCNGFRAALKAFLKEPQDDIEENNDEAQEPEAEKACPEPVTEKPAKTLAELRAKLEALEKREFERTEDIEEAKKNLRDYRRGITTVGAGSAWIPPMTPNDHLDDEDDETHESEPAEQGSDIVVIPAELEEFVNEQARRFRADYEREASRNHEVK